MTTRYTPENIETLPQNGIFVFGSNPAGYHVGGASKIALQNFGAIYGQGEGLQGKAYAIPTMLPSVDHIKPYVERFIKFAAANPGLQFYITKIGCGVAGFREYDIALMFSNALNMSNIILPESFVDIIKNQPKYTGLPMNSWNSYKDFLEKKNSIEKSIPLNINKLRQLYVDVFFNTIQICNSGFYITEEGKYVNLPDDSRMIKNTVLYKGTFSVNDVQSLDTNTIIEVTSRDCLKESIRLSNEGFIPAVLNMANRQRPGGGVLSGSRAQEESIFRRTNLFRSLYQFAPFSEIFGVTKSETQYPLDKDFGGVYSPDAIVFRDSEKNGCKLLDNPQYVSVITVAAMNRPMLTDDGFIIDSLVEGVKNKIRTIFRIGLKHHHDSLVLGAWGCGAFCNPPRHIATLFHEVLEEKEFKNKFRKIVFAIIEDHNSRKAHNPEGNLKPFQREFSNI